MLLPILATKLFIPSPRANLVQRPRLIARLDAGLASGHSLTLISAAAGCGKTTLISAWVASTARPVAWLSLDAGDNDPMRFLNYLVAALQTVGTTIGAGLVGLLQAPQPPPLEALLTMLLNDLTTISTPLILVLDDYHVIDVPAIDQALTFLLEHLPPPIHLVIVTRDDPPLPLARLRARNQLTELRAADLRFTSAEANEFLNQYMGLSLTPAEIAALESRTEGWVVGLHLAALSMQGQPDPSGFISSFTGSHHFVLDYLVEEVLQHQPDRIQSFLLRTALLERMCGPLCEAVLEGPAGSGQATLEYLEHANLFIIPLDHERRWYRYHHLFRDLLRQRLGQCLTADEIAEHHRCASQWYEDHDLGLEAFQHAVAANDIERAERLIEGKGMPLHVRSVSTVVLEWLASLSETTLQARPWLWVKAATLTLMSGQTAGVEEKLQAAENAIQNLNLDSRIRDLIGKIACARATLALTHYQPDIMIAQAQRALEYLQPDNLSFRFTASWALSSAYILRGERAAAAVACQECIAISQTSDDTFSKMLATALLGELQELDNQLYQAATTYRSILQLSGEYPQPNTGEVHLGLARIYYQWNDLEAAEQHARRSLQLTRLYDHVIDRFIIGEVFLARLQLAQGDLEAAAAMLAQSAQSALQKNFSMRLAEIAAAQVLVLLRQGNLATAAQLVQTYDLPLSQARVLLAQGHPSQALALLERLRHQIEAKGWQDERLRVMVLQAVALHAHGEIDTALQVLSEALVLAEPGGLIRIFVDEGAPLAELLSKMQHNSARQQAYIHTLLASFGHATASQPVSFNQDALIEPLSQRELEVLQLIAQGCSNREIGKRLFLALDTVKGHNRRIFEKLQVQRRTEAIARARELGLL